MPEPATRIPLPAPAPAPVSLSETLNQEFERKLKELLEEERDMLQSFADTSQDKENLDASADAAAGSGSFKTRGRVSAPPPPQSAMATVHQAWSSLDSSHFAEAAETSPHAPDREQSPHDDPHTDLLWPQARHHTHGPSPSTPGPDLAVENSTPLHAIPEDESAAATAAAAAVPMTPQPYDHGDRANWTLQQQDLSPIVLDDTTLLLANTPGSASSMPLSTVNSKARARAETRRHVPPTSPGSSSAEMSPPPPQGAPPPLREGHGDRPPAADAGHADGAELHHHHPQDTNDEPADQSTDALEREREVRLKQLQALYTVADMKLEQNADLRADYTRRRADLEDILVKVLDLAKQSPAFAFGDGRQELQQTRGLFEAISSIRSAAERGLPSDPIEQEELQQRKQATLRQVWELYHSDLPAEVAEGADAGAVAGAAAQDASRDDGNSGLTALQIETLLRALSLPAHGGPEAVSSMAAVILDPYEKSLEGEMSRSFLSNNGDYEDEADAECFFSEEAVRDFVRDVHEVWSTPAAALRSAHSTPERFHHHSRGPASPATPPHGPNSSRRRPSSRRKRLLLASNQRLRTTPQRRGTPRTSSDEHAARNNRSARDRTSHTGGSSATKLVQSSAQRLQQRRLESSIEAFLNALETAQRKLRSNAYTPRGIDPERVFRVLDRKKNGRITVAEFKHSSTRICKLREEWSDLVFSFLDASGRGALSLPDIEAFLGLQLRRRHSETPEDAVRVRIVAVLRKFLPPAAGDV